MESDAQIFYINSVLVSDSQVRLSYIQTNSKLGWTKFWAAHNSETKCQISAGVWFDLPDCDWEYNIHLKMSSSQFLIKFCNITTDMLDISFWRFVTIIWSWLQQCYDVTLLPHCVHNWQCNGVYFYTFRYVKFHWLIMFMIIIISTTGDC